MKIEIWSDVVCPWCYIGKRRMERAVAGFGGDVEVTWRSFELDPGAPRALDLPLDAFLARKYRMSLERARQMIDRVTSLAAEEGVVFDLDRARGGNTFDAHRLIHIASDEGRGDAMKERLLSAYFTEGLDIGDLEVLASLAEEVGLETEITAELLRAGAKSEAVRADEVRAHQMGVSGVPFFLIDGKYAVAGAQPTEVLLDVLERLAEMPTITEGAGCESEACEV